MGEGVGEREKVKLPASSTPQSQFLPLPRGEGLPFLSYRGMCPPRGMVFETFGLKIGIDSNHFHL